MYKQTKKIKISHDTNILSILTYINDNDITYKQKIKTLYDDETITYNFKCEKGITNTDNISEILIITPENEHDYVIVENMTKKLCKIAGIEEKDWDKNNNTRNFTEIEKIQTLIQTHKNLFTNYKFYNLKFNPKK